VQRAVSFEHLLNWAVIFGFRNKEKNLTKNTCRKINLIFYFLQGAVSVYNSAGPQWSLWWCLVHSLLPWWHYSGHRLQRGYPYSLGCRKGKKNPIIFHFMHIHGWRLKMCWLFKIVFKTKKWMYEFLISLCCLLDQTNSISCIYIVKDLSIRLAVKMVFKTLEWIYECLISLSLSPCLIIIPNKSSR